MTVTCEPFAHDGGLGKRDRVIAFGDVALGGAVDALRLEEEHRIGVADGREKEALGVVGVGRAHDFEARHVDEERFRRLRVIEPAADAAAHRGADDELGRILTARSIAVLGKLGDDLVVGRKDEVGELDLGNGHQAVERHADGRADDAALREGRVDDAVVAELVVKARRHAEDAAHLADVFAHDDDARIAPHLQPEPVVDRLHHVHLRHRRT